VTEDFVASVDIDEVANTVGGEFAASLAQGITVDRLDRFPHF